MKKYFIVSDFHLNMGRRDGELHPLEDFDADDQFAELLDIALEAGAELIINGDWVDFLQLEPFVPAGHVYSSKGVPLAWTHHEARQKLETCFSNNPRHFQDLKVFLEKGGRLTVMQGNHDPDWFFPATQEGAEPPIQWMLRQELGNPSGEVLRFKDTSLRLGPVHVEHGHQSCEVVNSFQDHPHIFHSEEGSDSGPLRYELIWGSRLLLEFFNDLELEHPYADNLKTTTRAVWLGIKNGWVGPSLAADFLLFLWGSGISLRHLDDLLAAPERDVVRLIQGLENPQLRELYFNRIRRDPEFRRELEASLQSAPDEEWRSVSRRNARSDFGEEEVVAGEGELLGVIRESRELRSARQILEQPGVSAVVFGHTHSETDGNDGDAPVKNYFNTGTWTPRFDLRKPENKKLLKSEFPLTVLSDRSLFERVLPYAEVQVSSPSRAKVELLFI